MTRLPRSSARRKAVRGWPWDVMPHTSVPGPDKLEPSRSVSSEEVSKKGSRPRLFRRGLDCPLLSRPPVGGLRRKLVSFDRLAARELVDHDVVDRDVPQLRLAVLVLHQVDAADLPEGTGTRLSAVELDMRPAVAGIRVGAPGATEEQIRLVGGDVETRRTGTAVALHVERELRELLALDALDART